MKKTQLVLTTLAVAALATVSAKAQNYLNTFDNSGSFVTSTSFPAFGSYGLDNPGSPQVPNVRFDFGSPTATANNSIAFSSTENNGAAGSGSLALSWNWNFTADGASAAAFTMDLLNNAQTYSSISFDILIDPSSTVGLNGDYGFFQVATRNGAYNFDSTSLGEGFTTAGVWEHVTIPLDGSDNSIRALTFQDFDDANRSINGTETIYIDNLALNVPEPSTVALLGAGVAGLLSLRRNRKG
jgi:hypothetical protein